MAQKELTPQDETLIRDEEARYAASFRRVNEALKAKTAELGDDEKLARKLTAAVVAEKRDEEKQFLQSDEKVAHGLARLRLSQANALSDLSRQPYFARVVYREKGRDVEFKLGVAGFPEERIVDWRKAPISKLYYDYEEGQDYDDEIAGVERRGTVLLKRAYKGHASGLCGIETRDYSYAKSKGSWHRFKKQGRTLFSVKDKEKVRALMAANAPIAPEQLAAEDGYLSQILSLISPEQFRLISSDLRHPVVIQGSAGTGKTTVALHRLAWLLFEGNSEARAENCLVVMPNATLARYVSNVLPGLGVGGVKIATFAEWEKDIALPPAARRFPAVFDHLLVDEVQDFSAAQLRKLLHALKDGRQLTLAGDLGQKIHAEGGFSGWDALLKELELPAGGVINLSVAYRSTYQIYEIAESVRDPDLSDEDLKMFPRFGPDPELTICHNFTQAAERARSWIEDVVNVNQGAIGAVVCRDAGEAFRLYSALADSGLPGIRLGDARHFDFTPGITVTDAAQVKGLEFQSVLIFNPGVAQYRPEDARERNLLYVAITRAAYRLDFVCYEMPTPMLPDFIQLRDLTATEDEADETRRLREMYDEMRAEEAALRGEEPVREKTEDEEADPDGEGRDSGRDMLDELDDGSADDDVPEFDGED